MDKWMDGQTDGHMDGRTGRRQETISFVVGKGFLCIKVCFGSQIHGHIKRGRKKERKKQANKESERERKKERKTVKEEQYVEQQSGQTDIKRHKETVRQTDIQTEKY